MISRGPSVMRLAQFVNGNPYKPEDFGDVGEPVIRIRQLLDPSADVELAPPPARPVWLADGDLVFSWSATLAVRFWYRGKALLNQHLFRVDVGRGINRRWFVYVLEEAVHRLEPLMHGSAMTHITLDMLRSVTVAVPSPETQVAMADYLDRETVLIDRLIQLKQKQAMALNERLQATRNEWVRSQYDRWGRAPLRRSLSRVEQGWSPQCDAAEAAVDEWGVIKTSAVTSGTFQPAENKALPPDIAPDRRWMIHDGDLLMARGSGSAGSVGQVAVAETDGRRLMLCDLVYRLVLLGSNCPQYFAAVLTAPILRGYVEGAIRSDAGQTLKLRADDVKVLPVPAAPTPEQKTAWEALARVCVPIQEATARLDVQVRLLQERRQAVITAAVTGELKIPEVAA